MHNKDPRRFSSTAKKATLIFLSVFALIQPSLFAGRGIESLVCVSGIICAREGSSAIVNGEIVAEGDTVGRGITIITISDSWIQCEYKNRRFIKHLGEDCKTGAQKKDTPRRRDPKQKSSVPSSSSRHTFCHPSAKEKYIKAKESYAWALSEYTLSKFENAYLLWRRAVRYAQDAMPLLDTARRREMEKMILEFRRKSTQMGTAIKAIKKAQLPQLEKVRDISKWLSRHIVYKSDWNLHGDKEYWQTPRETMYLKIGDCEDFAFFAQKMLANMGISSKVIGIQYLQDNTTHGHAICVYPAGSSYSYLNCSRIFATNERDIKNLVEALYPQWVIIHELNIRARTVKTLFKNSFASHSP